MIYFCDAYSYQSYVVCLDFYLCFVGEGGDWACNELSNIMHDVDYEYF